MNKQQAQSEILRRLINYWNVWSTDMHPKKEAEGSFKLYNKGELSKEKLLNMITQDSEGDILSKPIGYNRWLKYGEFGKLMKDAGNSTQQKYHKARKEAEQLIESYGK